MSHDETCSVCGRTILAGERTRAYVSQAGRHDVCELCVPRTERLGWEREREGMPEALPAPEKRGFLAGLLRRRPRREAAAPAEAPELEPALAADAAVPGAADDTSEAALATGDAAEAALAADDASEAALGVDDAAEVPAGADDAAEVPAGADHAAEAPAVALAGPEGQDGREEYPEAAEPVGAEERVEAEERVGAQERVEAEERVERAPTPPAPTPRRDPAARGRRPQRLDPEPTLLSPFERAVARFNASEASRTVGGLVRTLGAPWVSVGASAGAPKEVRITVAWELSWYQWGVDLGDELRPVFPIDKGLEMDQLDTAARQWNASAADGGRLVLVAPARRRSPDGAGSR